jgi:type III pantothenate kinase
MNLIVDIGNSFVKIFLFDKFEIIHFERFVSDENIYKHECFKGMDGIDKAIISSVGYIPEAFIIYLKQYVKEVLVLDHKTAIPVKNLYKTPETLGKDRLAGVIGAYHIFKQHHVLAIDAGTALTFDFVNKNAEYVGGNISPGLEMRFRALNHFTKKLPMLEKQDQFPIIGQCTDEAIVAGVQNGIIFEIDAYINEMNRNYEDLKVILTGGDTFFFEHKLKNIIFAEPNLVAIGLNYILQFNHEMNV